MYEIVIKRKVFKDTRCGHEWKIVKEDFWTKKEMKEEDYHKQQEIDKAYSEGKIPKKCHWGYTPETIKSVESETELYRQNVDELDLVKVIKAINGI